jgi:hypothetical protein
VSFIQAPQAPTEREQPASFRSYLLFFSGTLLVVCVMYISYLLGVRRIQHDTQLYTYAVRAFLSDSIHQRSFPLWDPFSNMGIPMGAAPNHSIYNPFALISATLFHYTTFTTVLEFCMTALLALYGSFLWLRLQRASVPLALAGAIAYAGSPGLFNLHMCYPASISAALLPWLFFAAESIAIGARTRDRLLGVIIGAVCPWLLFVGGYIGLVLMLLPFAIVYVMGLKVIDRSLFNGQECARFVFFTLMTIALALALVFLPLSEFLIAYYGHFEELRKSYTPNFSPYEGALSYTAPLTLFMANSGSIQVPGSGQMYVTAGLALTLPALLLSRRLGARDYLLLALAVLSAAAAMGKNSPVAVFCVSFLPGFKNARWHNFFACVPMLLLITFLVRGLEAFLNSDRTELLVRCQRAAKAVIITALAVLTLTVLIAFSGQPTDVPWPFAMTYYEFAATAAVGFCAVLAMALWFWRSRGLANGIDVLKFGAVPLILLATTAAAYKSLSSEARGNVLSALGVDVHDAALITGRGLFAFLDGLKTHVSVPALIGMDALQFILVAGALAMLFRLVPKFGRHWFACSLLLLVACDATLAMQRYQQGNTYWLTSQADPHRDERSPQIAYEGNARDLSTTYLGPPDWTQTRSFFNIALMRREPTFRSYNPFVDTHMVALADIPAGFQLCSRLVWFFSGASELTLADAQARAATPVSLTTKLMSNTMDVAIVTTEPGRVVFTDAWSPGWTATINGEPVAIEKVFGAVKAVTIPAGASNIHFKYRPPYLKEGLLLFAAAIVAIGVMGAYIVRTREILFC